jgi:hypothetical protein
VTWHLSYAAYALAIVAVTSIILKYTWYDHLKDLEHINEASVAGIEKGLTSAAH